MLILIDSNFKALRTGRYVKADEEAGEFILNSKECDHKVATLLEIGAANKIELSKGKQPEVLKELVAGIKKLELPKMSEKPESERVKDIIIAGVEKGDDDDAMMIDLIGIGIKFKNVNKIFNDAMEAGGFRVSNKNRKEAIRAILVGAEFAPDNYAQVTSMIELVQKGRPGVEEDEDEGVIAVEAIAAVADTTTSQAMKSIKDFCKEFEIVLPKPEKAAKGGFKVVVQLAVIANPSMTKAEFVTLCEEKKKDVEKALKLHYPSVVWAQQVRAAPEPEAEKKAA